MTVGGRGVFVGSFTMFESRSRVLFSLFVLPNSVVMPRLMMMMRGGVVVGGRLMVMLACWMLR
jgi:hypothetical protein